MGNGRITTTSWTEREEERFITLGRIGLRGLGCCKIFVSLRPSFISPLASRDRTNRAETSTERRRVSLFPFPPNFSPSPRLGSLHLPLQVRPRRRSSSPSRRRSQPLSRHLRSGPRLLSQLVRPPRSHPSFLPLRPFPHRLRPTQPGSSAAAREEGGWGCRQTHHEEVGSGTEEEQPERGLGSGYRDGVGVRRETDACVLEGRTGGWE
ncbi:hypothetical protein BDY24DRAFT_247619 [Mrakia frigida]|uniref:uncharacterized protein n=1 Tax=Mrakia frigida TaxID=29902 RepID=UPI003FCC0CA9